MKGKFLSPYSMPGMGYRGFGGGYGGYGGMGMGGMGGIGGAMAAAGGMKMGKKVIGTLIKLQIAKYAMKFGIGAAKLYFEAKLGRELEDVIIEKFISRYHRQRTRHLDREYYAAQPRLGSDMKKGKNETKIPLNITIGNKR